VIRELAGKGLAAVGPKTEQVTQTINIKIVKG
jgi:hypothetical protein